MKRAWPQNLSKLKTSEAFGLCNAFSRTVQALTNEAHSETELEEGTFYLPDYGDRYVHSLQVFQGKMNFLNVANGLQLPFVRVRNKALIGLNGQTVATAVRDTLRRAYKKSEIKVSQTASLDQDGWQGRCWIQGVEYSYRISSQPASDVSARP